MKEYEERCIGVVVFVDDDVLMVSFSSKKRDEADNDADDKNYLQ